MMVTSELTFPNVETALVRWASQVFPQLSPNPYMRAGDELPSKYSGRLPFLEISDRGGRMDGVTLFSEVEFHLFHTDRFEARDLLAEVFAKISLYPRKFGGISVDTVQVVVYPRRSKQQEPDDETYCFSGEVIISTRRQKGN